MSTIETLERHEHAEHAFEHGSKQAALLVAILAALLAVAEVQGKQAELQVQSNLIAAADAWNQYQAKAVRQAIARDLERLSATLDMPAQPALATKRAAPLETFRADQKHYESDPKDGKQAISQRARAFEAARNESIERFHAFDNATAALQLGIVLATASAITRAKLLLWMAIALGVVGVVLAVLARVAPSLGAF